MIVAKSDGLQFFIMPEFRVSGGCGEACRCPGVGKRVALRERRGREVCRMRGDLMWDPLFVEMLYLLMKTSLY